MFALLAAAMVLQVSLLVTGVKIAFTVLKAYVSVQRVNKKEGITAKILNEDREHVLGLKFGNRCEAE